MISKVKEDSKVVEQREKGLNVFKCQKCGGSKLSYQKYVQSLSEVLIKDSGHIEYGLSKIDEENELGAVQSYICRSCGTSLSFRGGIIETEEDLRFYLSMTPEELKEAEEEYLVEQEQNSITEDYSVEVEESEG